MNTRLRALRLQKKWTQKDVADKLGCAVNTYGLYERGKYEIPIIVIVQLSFLYNVSVQYIVMKTDDPTPPGKYRTFEEWKEQNTKWKRTAE